MKYFITASIPFSCEGNNKNQINFSDTAISFSDFKDIQGRAVAEINSKCLKD